MFGVSRISRGIGPFSDDPLNRSSASDDLFRVPQSQERSPFDLRAAAWDAAETAAAVRLIPVGPFVISSGFEGKRAGVLALSVSLCANEPLLIAVAMRKGHPIEPLIRDSRALAVCRIAPDDRLTPRVFAQDHAHDADPFDALAVETLVTGAPVLSRAAMALDCEVVRHFDMEADCELFIGRVLAGRVYPGNEPSGRWTPHPPDGRPGAETHRNGAHH